MSHVDLKVVLLGKEYGGKTSLVERYLYDRFDGTTPYQNTIGAAYGAKQVTIDKQKVTLGIWDTAGSERYEAMSRIYYRGAGAAIVCFDTTDVESYRKAEMWVKELRKHEEKCRIYLCGTKHDLVEEGRQPRAVEKSVAEQYAEQLGADLYETSSKTGEGVVELFTRVAKDYVESGNVQRERSDSRFSIREPQRFQKLGRGCC